jgi:hypothetical protein
MNMVRKETPLPEPRDESAAVLSMIARAASDPSIDIDKMERLMQMQERAIQRQAQTAYDADMAAMQPELPSIGERGDAAGRYTFAKWEDIQAAIKPVLQKFGFALTFRTDTGTTVKVTGILSHKSGHREETSIVLPSDPSGNKNAVQAVASSVQYGKRYTAGALLNLTSHGEDDDGFTGGGGYDASDWYAAIDGAADATELGHIADDIKAAKGIPPAALKQIRAAWSAKATKIKGAK